LARSLARAVHRNSPAASNPATPTYTTERIVQAPPEAFVRYTRLMTTIESQRQRNRKAKFATVGGQIGA
jgi:hypothetical protein